MAKAEQKGTEAELREANKIFFNKTAQIYEKVDHRRSDELTVWVGDTIKEMASKAGSDALLDIGCGTGLVARRAVGTFKNIYGIDISVEMAKKAKGICGDVVTMPFKSNSFNAISCFATLHHLPNFKDTFKEVYRILKSGGVFYTDHDMDEKFMNRFFIPMKVYRKVFNMGKKYVKEAEGIDEDLYHKSEIHEDGINTDFILNSLREAGFSQVSVRFHWLGFSKVTNKILQKLGLEASRRGFAPFVSIFAVK